MGTASRRPSVNVSKVGLVHAGAPQVAAGALSVSTIKMGRKFGLAGVHSKETLLQWQVALEKLVEVWDSRAQQTRHFKVQSLDLPEISSADLCSSKARRCI